MVMQFSDTKINRDDPSPCREHLPGQWLISSGILLQTSKLYSNMQSSLTSTISGHADSGKEMKQFSFLDVRRGNSSGHLLTTSISRRISRFTSKFYSYMLVSFSYHKHAVYAAR